LNSLISNKTNLLPLVKDFIQESETVTIYSAFIKDNLLNEIIESGHGSIKQIVVRFQPYDLIMGVSDLEIYETCIANNITIYRNPRLHAKCILNEKNDCILGSANFTNNGMRNKPSSNWEINTRVNSIDLESSLLLQKILLDSELVTQEWVDEIKKKIESHSIKLPKVELPQQKQEKDFLLSALPLSASPGRLFELINQINKGKKSDSISVLEKEAALHDMALYDLQLSDFDDIDHFFSVLRDRFVSHPFINSFVDYVHQIKNQRCGYTEACDWLSTNCEDVPVPSRYTIRDKPIVAPLFKWCDYFIESITNEDRYGSGGRNQIVINS